MGKGDKRSKKGKINIGSYGVSRPRPSAVNKKKEANASAAPKVKKEKAAPKAKAATAKTSKAETTKPAAAKKTTKKKTEE
jgi:30S ribosomal protein S31